MSKLVNPLELHKLTGKARDTIHKRLDGLEWEPGPLKSKLYDSELALLRIYQIHEHAPSKITNEEAQRQLTIARREQIDLEMEVTRKERLAKDDVKELLDSTFANVGGLLKAHRGKLLDEQAMADIFTELQSANA